jgi:hypothetical protein
LRPDREAVLAWEQRWSRPAALAALGAIALIAAAIVVASQAIGSTDGDAELLRTIDAHRSAQLISSILQGIGVGLLAVPLYYLFRAAKARSETMRGQLVGVVIAAPLFLAVLAILSGLSNLEAASDFVSNEVPRLMAQGVALSSDRANDAASNTISDSSLRPLAAGFGIGGQIGFVVAMFYTALQAMRVGLLTRFWGSLGMALGAVSFIFFQFTLLWFVYLGLLLAGWVPGGKPPAWRSGEAEPWPTPGEKASSALGSDDDELQNWDGPELEEPTVLESGESPADKGQSQ